MLTVLEKELITLCNSTGDLLLYRFLDSGAFRGVATANKNPSDFIGRWKNIPLMIECKETVNDRMVASAIYRNENQVKSLQEFSKNGIAIYIILLKGINDLLILDVKDLPQQGRIDMTTPNIIYSKFYPKINMRTNLERALNELQAKIK